MELETIKKAVEVYFNYKDLNELTRERPYVYARVIYAVISKRRTNYSYHTIGKVINKNHATILHYVKNIYPAWEFQKKVFVSHLKDIQNIEEVLDNKLEALNDPTAFIGKLERDLELISIEKETLEKNLEFYKKELKNANRTISWQSKTIKRLKQYEPNW